MSLCDHSFLGYMAITTSTPQCKTVGVYYVKNGEKRGRVAYPDIAAALRLHQSSIDREIPQHHRQRTLLESIAEIDLVKNILLDCMHLVCLSVLRKLLLHWTNTQTTKHLPNDIPSKLIPNSITFCVVFRSLLFFSSRTNFTK